MEKPTLILYKTPLQKSAFQVGFASEFSVSLAALQSELLE
jgi:hypothetical protein